MATEALGLSIAGPGSPVSLAKFLANQEIKEITLLVDGSGGGIINDDPDTINIGPQERVEQAEYYRQTFYMKQNKRIPAYLYRYLHYMFIDDSRDMRYPTDESLAEAFRSGEISEAHQDYQHIKNLIEYSDKNIEAAHIIGFVILLTAMINQARKANVGIRFFIEHPETALHPKRQSRWINMFSHLRDEFGGKIEQIKT